MAYISILVPAFQTKETDDIEIKKICAVQFDRTCDDFDLIKLSDSSKANYALRFKQSSLSLEKIEDFIYKRDCIKSLVEKTFESLQTMSDKLSNMEKEFNTALNENNVPKIEDGKKNLEKLLIDQLDKSESFRINTERIISKIKDDFKLMILGLESMQKQTTNKHKSVKSVDFNADKSSNIKLLSSGKAKVKAGADLINKSNVPKLNFNK